MPLNKTTLKNDLLAMFNDKDNTPEEAATKLSNIIDTYVRTALVTVTAGISVQVNTSNGVGETTSTGTGSLS